MADGVQEVREINKYIDNLTIKALGVENDSVDVLKRIHLVEENLRALSKDAHLEIHDTRDLLRETESELKEVGMRLEKLIRQFRDVVKKEDFARFELRVDEWPLEQFATKKDLKRD